MSVDGTQNHSQRLRSADSREKALVFGVLIFCLACAPKTAVNPTSVKEQVGALVKQAWQEIKRATPRPKPSDAAGPPGDVGWDYVISPAFPSAWPPDGKGLVYYYAYATGLRMGLMDAEVVAAPWGRVKVDATGKQAPQMEILRKQLKEAGRQGVRPLKQEEIDIYKGKDAVEAQVSLLSRATSLKDVDAAALQRYYCQWLKDNGTVADEIRPFQIEFFKWLACR